jgi:O-antigen ligase
VAPRFTLRVSRREAVAAASLVVCAGVAARAVLGGAVPLGAEGQGWRVAVVVAACLCAPAAWAAISLLARRWSSAVVACGIAAVIASGTVGGFAGSLAPSASAPPAAAVQQVRTRPVNDDVLHGRRAIWDAGLEAFRQQPVQGHGAAGFLSATLELQPRPATTYAHALPLELGVELGLAGLLLAIGLYVVPIRACWKARAASDGWLLIVPVLAFLIANLVDWPWHIAGLGAVWAAATGAVIGAGRTALPKLVLPLTLRWAAPRHRPYASPTDQRR